MDHSYASRKQTENVPEEKEKLTEEQGPSLAALSSGAADPTPQQRGTPVDLPAAMRAKMENAFGADLSAVRLYESRAVAETGASAMSRGTDIAFAPGLIDFTSFGGQALLGHEISHVVSQARGEVTGDGFLADGALEARADREGAMAAAGEQIAMPTAALSPVTVAGTTGPIQAAGKDKDVDEDEADPGRKTIGTPPAPPPPVAAAQTPAVAPPAPPAPSASVQGAADAEAIPTITLPGAKDPAPAAASGPGGAGAAPAAAQGSTTDFSLLSRSNPAFYRANLDIARGKLAEEDREQYDALMDMFISDKIIIQNDLPAKQRTAETGYQPPTEEMFQKAIGWNPKEDYAQGSKEYEKQFRAFRNNRANWYNPEVKHYNDLANIVIGEQSRQSRLPNEVKSAQPEAQQQAPMQQPMSDYGALTPEQQMQMQMMQLQMQMQMMNGGMGMGMMQPDMGMGMGMPMMDAGGMAQSAGQTSSGGAAAEGAAASETGQAEEGAAKAPEEVDAAAGEGSPAEAAEAAEEPPKAAEAPGAAGPGDESPASAWGARPAGNRGRRLLGRARPQVWERTEPVSDKEQFLLGRARQGSPNSYSAERKMAQDAGLSEEETRAFLNAVASYNHGVRIARSELPPNVKEVFRKYWLSTSWSEGMGDYIVDDLPQGQPEAADAAAGAGQAPAQVSPGGAPPEAVPAATGQAGELTAEKNAQQGAQPTGETQSNAAAVTPGVNMGMGMGMMPNMGMMPGMGMGMGMMGMDPMAQMQTITNLQQQIASQNQQLQLLQAQNAKQQAKIRQQEELIQLFKDKLKMGPDEDLTAQD